MAGFTLISALTSSASAAASSAVASHRRRVTLNPRSRTPGPHPVVRADMQQTAFTLARRRRRQNTTVVSPGLMVGTRRSVLVPCNVSPTDDAGAADDGDDDDKGERERAKHDTSKKKNKPK